MNSKIAGVNRSRITKDLLYGISHKLYKVRSSLEQYLFKHTYELFDLEVKLILYDLTNTYFEAECLVVFSPNLTVAREKRSDARIVVLAVLIKRKALLSTLIF